MSRPMNNIVEKANEVKVNHNYCLTIRDADELSRGCESRYDLAWIAFKYGYLQGHKAAVAEMKKKGGH